MTPPRFSIVVAGYVIDQQADGTWTMTQPPSKFGYDSSEDMLRDAGFLLEPEPMEDAGFAHAPSMGEIVVALVTKLPAYRATIADVCGPPMMPISNQPWCPFEDEHQPHVQCQECKR